MTRTFALFLALAVLAGCVVRPAPEPEPDPCYTLLVTCGGESDPVSVWDHWTELHPPCLEMLCYAKCEGGRACVPADGCTWLEVR